MYKYIKSVLPRQQQRLWFWVIMIVLISFYPYQFASAYYPFLSSSSRVYGILFLAFLPFAILSSSKRMPKPYIISIIIMIFGGLLSYIVSGNKYYYHRIIVLLLSVTISMIVYKKIGFKQFYELYNRWILLMVIGCFFGVIFAYIGIPPIQEFVESSDGRIMHSWGITFAKGYTGPGSLMRPSGFFDEPGAMGYFCCFAIAYNRLLIKDKRMEILLLFFSLFTFSFGYIIQALVYILLFFVFNNNLKSRSWFIVLFSVSLCGLYATKDTQYNEVYENSIGKIENLFINDQVMNLENTSREQLTENGKIAFQENPVWGIGRSMDDSIYGAVQDNIYETLARDGIVGFIYMYFPFFLLLFWGIKRRDMEIISIVIFLALSLFHRPLHAYPLNFFIFYSLPIVYYLKILEDDLNKNHGFVQNTIYDVKY